MLQLCEDGVFRSAAAKVSGHAQARCEFAQLVLPLAQERVGRDHDRRAQVHRRRRRPRLPLGVRLGDLGSLPSPGTRKGGFLVLLHEIDVLAWLVSAPPAATSIIPFAVDGQLQTLSRVDLCPTPQLGQVTCAADGWPRLRQYQGRTDACLAHPRLVTEPAATHRTLWGIRLILSLHLAIAEQQLVLRCALHVKHEGEALLLVRPERRSQPFRLRLLQRVHLCNFLHHALRRPLVCKMVQRCENRRDSHGRL
mmetsp:Transcript_1395/g.2874  ORF Transcript_1395/g.2874 Transcript_1395/m.2874 type:complete len:252 (+) Transcript_1395:1638-2393(+)